MGLFDHFPYTNVHELNLDWVLSMMKALEAEWESFTAGNSLTFADPMLYDASKTYAKNTIVLDGNGNAYVSIQAVPIGIGLQNSEYWLMVFDYEAFIEKVNKNFTARYYRGQYRATAAMAIGDWLTVDDILCKATAAIAAYEHLEFGVNIEPFTLEDFIKAFMHSANQLIQQYKNDIDASELLYRQQLAQDIANTTSSLQSQLDLAISGVTVDSEVINARLGGDGTTYPILGDAIRTQFHKSLHCLDIMVSTGNLATYPDADNYPENSIFLVNPTVAASVAHTPYTTCGYLINTYSYIYNTATPHGGMFQIAYPWANATEYVKMRSHNGSSWGAWRKTTPIEINEFMQSAGIAVYNAATLASYPDLNNYPMNKIILVQAAYASQVAHSPFTNCAYNILSTGYQYSGTAYGGIIQIAVPIDYNEPVKFRFYGNTWGTWRTYIPNMDEYLQSGKLIITSATDVSNYPDLDNYPMNKIVLVNYNQAANIAHSPFTDCSYVFISTGPYYANAPYGGMIQIAIPSLLSSGKTIVWRSHNGGSFTEWQSAAPNIFVADNTNFIDVINNARKIRGSKVYLSAGSYALFDSTHDEAYWKSIRPSTRYTGIILDNDIEIIGMGKATLNAQYTGSDSDIKENFSIFNIAGSCKIKNLIMNARNICYCIHDDSAIISNDATSAEIENCIMTHNGSNHTFMYGAPICIGGSTSSFIDRKISSCYFKSVNDTRNISYHTSSNGYGMINLTNNYFDNGSIAFAAMGTGGELVAHVSNNRLHSAMTGTTATGITVWDYNNIIQ